MARGVTEIQMFSTDISNVEGLWLERVQICEWDTNSVDI